MIDEFLQIVISDSSFMCAILYYVSVIKMILIVDCRCNFSKKLFSESKPPKL